jgi:hypothetical protein
MLKKVDVLIQGPSLVGENLTVPTMGRLVFGIVAIVLWFAFPGSLRKQQRKACILLLHTFPVACLFILLLVYVCQRLIPGDTALSYTY